MEQGRDELRHRTFAGGDELSLMVVDVVAAAIGLSEEKSGGGGGGRSDAGENWRRSTMSDVVFILSRLTLAFVRRNDERLFSGLANFSI